MSGLTGLRERKKLATRQALHLAAFELVEQHGLAATTVEAISDRAGVAPRTFWAYFASKEDAVIDRDSGWAESLGEALLARPAGEDTVTALRHVVESSVADRAVDSQLSVRRQMLIRREPHLMAAAAAAFDEIERVLTSAVAKRLRSDPASDLTPDVVVAAVCGLCRVALNRWAASGGEQSYTELVQRAFDSLAAVTAASPMMGASR